jgi:hypothetical protein
MSGRPVRSACSGTDVGTMSLADVVAIVAMVTGPFSGDGSQGQRA